MVIEQGTHGVVYKKCCKEISIVKHRDRFWRSGDLRRECLRALYVVGMESHKKTTYSVYAIRSLATGRIYIGQTENFEDQLREHNVGGVRSPKEDMRWDL